jgi:predicted Fe-Mo cluster-binding NifX family protein
MILEGLFMKILISLEDNNNLDSKLSNHFGTCNFFAIYDSVLKELKIIKNYLDHNSSKSPVDQILENNIDSVFSKGMGKKAIDLFLEKKIILKTGNYTFLKEVIENIADLKDLNTPCKH